MAQDPYLNHSQMPFIAIAGRLGAMGGDRRSELVEEILGRFTAAGGRRTASRQAIVEAVLRPGGPITPGPIAPPLPAPVPSVHPATVHPTPHPPAEPPVVG